MSSAIETLRALAVLLVFVHHLHSAANLTTPYFAYVGGWLGVQIFFVVSGYLIYISASRYDLRSYFFHRFFRIYPAYIFWFFAFLLVFGYFQRDDGDFSGLLIHLLFLQHFSPTDYSKYNSLYVSWTLTIEIVWYVFAFLLAPKIKDQPLKVTAFFLVTSLFWVSSGYKYFPAYESLSSGEKVFFAHNNVIAQLPFFFFGALIARFEPIFDRAALLTLFLLTVVIFPAWQSMFPNPIFVTGLGVSALFLLLKGVDYKNNRIISLFSDISYSFYLIHYPIIVLVAKYGANKYWLPILALGLTVLFSYISFRLIEVPFIKFGKNLSMRKRLA